MSGKRKAPDGGWGMRIESADAKCPFYRYQHGTRVRCEGVEEGSNVEFMFNSASMFYDFLAARCESDYQHCRWAQAMFAYYRGE